MAMSDAETPQPTTPTAVTATAVDKKRSPAPPASKVESLEDVGSSSHGISWRERLKRHRVEMAARSVSVPDLWGQEVSLVKDWDSEVGRSVALDRALFPVGLLAARESLVEECRRHNRSGRGAAGRSSAAAAPASVRVVSNSC